LEVIERNMALQARLIEDLLDVSRIIAGKLHLEPRPVAIRDVAEAAIDVRLFTELQEKNRALTEAHAQVPYSPAFIRSSAADRRFTRSSTSSRVAS
jgi:signal transduction histidine kinase